MLFGVRYGFFHALVKSRPEPVRAASTGGTPLYESQIVPQNFWRLERFFRLAGLLTAVFDVMGVGS